MSNALNDWLGNIQSNNKCDIDTCLAFTDSIFMRHVRDGNIKRPDTLFHLTKFEPDTISTRLASLSGCANGYHDIPFQVLKYCHAELSHVICSFMNGMLVTSDIPDSWKTAIATPLHKKGDTTNCHNYRGISVLPPIDGGCTAD
jgi:hypothetical protein